MKKNKLVLISIAIVLLLFATSISNTKKINSVKMAKSNFLKNVVKDSLMAIEIAEIILSRNYDSILEANKLPLIKQQKPIIAYKKKDKWIVLTKRVDGTVGGGSAFIKLNTNTCEVIDMGLMK